MRHTFLILLIPYLLSAQGFYRTDTDPAIRWGRQDTDKIVEHYISAAEEPTISSNVQLAFTNNLVSANDRYWFWKDTTGTNISAFGMNGSNHFVIGSGSAPAGTDTGDMLFYRRGELIYKLTGIGPVSWIEPGPTSISLGLGSNPFSAVRGLLLEARGNTVNQGSLFLYGANNIDAIKLHPSSSTANYDIRFPAAAATATGQALLVQSIGGIPGAPEMVMEWAGAGIGYPLSHVGSGDITHSLATDGQNLTLALTSHSDTAQNDRGALLVRRTRGTNSTPNNISAGDRLGALSGQGWAAGAFSAAATIEFRAQGISGPNVSASIDFFTRNAAGTLANRWQVGSEGHLMPITDNTVDFSSSTSRPATSYLRNVDISNDRQIYMRDTAGTPISVMHFNTSNYAAIGTLSAPTGANSGDVLFYRRGTLMFKLTGLDPATPWIEPGTNISLGRASNSFSSVHATTLNARGGANPGSLFLFGTNNLDSVKILPADATANYDIRLPTAAAVSIGQSLVVQSIGGIPGAPQMVMEWGGGGGVSYPFNHLGTAGGGDVSHLLQTESQNVTLSMRAFSSVAASDRGGYTMARARGTSASPANIVANDRQGVIGVIGYVGGAFRTTSTINWYADSVDTFNNRIPTRVEFGTMNAAGSLAARWVLDAEGHWRPGTDNAWTLGTTSLRPSVTYTRGLDVNGNVSSNLIPSLSGTYALGGPSNYWGGSYFAGIVLAGGVSFNTGGVYDIASSGVRAGTIYTTNLNVSGTCTGCGGGSPTWTSVPSSIIPSSDNTYNLGSNTFRWANGYMATIWSTTGVFSTGISATSVGVGPLLGGAGTLVFNSGSTVTAPSGNPGLTGAFSGQVCTGGDYVKNLTVSAGIITAVVCAP